MEKVKDRLWLWGQKNHHLHYHLPGESKIEPVQAARYLGTPNILIVRYGDWPPLPYEPLAESLRELKQVVWSIAGAGGATINGQESDLKEVLALAQSFPNITGAIMDDFFEEGKARWTREQVRGYRQTLHSFSPKINLWCVLYLDRDLRDDIKAYLDEFDIITLWTWRARNLKALEKNFHQAVALAPRKRFVLGCYMWDYGDDQPLPLSEMETQCELGLRWLRSGLIEGLIFLASCLCDLHLPTVAFAREWVSQVGEKRLTD
ncbi:MAG: hypothetical protein NC911_05850 [Candidatus Omnitrophica bacterium]|nr:hypothetical protein [Candidatus Omnitrophota bacterium]